MPAMSPWTRCAIPSASFYFPYGSGRDPARTPMPWIADAPNAGFTTGKPWLPVDPVHAQMAANVQEGHPNFVLTFARATIARAGAQCPPSSPATSKSSRPATRSWRSSRFTPDQSVLCVFNLSREPAVYALPKQLSVSPFEFGPGGWGFGGGGLSLKPSGAFIGQLG